jgi:glucose-6-phosphate-specific signal transduction histidine kinase
MIRIRSYALPVLGTPYWSQGNQLITLLAVSVGFVLAQIGVGMLIYLIQPEEIDATFLLIPLFGVLGFISVWYTGKTLTMYRKVKWVALSLQEAHQLVTSVLKGMNLHYEGDKKQFHLVSSGLAIHIRKGYLQYSLTRGSIIILVSLHPRDLPIANTLRQRIDEALKPRGLTP